MKNYIKYIIALSIVSILGIGIYVGCGYKEKYDEVVVVEKKEEALKSLNESIPKEIVISTKFYSKTVITSKLKIDDIVEAINLIKRANTRADEVLEGENSSYTVNGKIYYNNKVDTFSLNNKLTFNGEEYKANSYQINMLHRKLFNYFNTYKHLIDILNTERSSVYCVSNNDEKILDNNEKNKLIEKLKSLKPMSDEKKLKSTSIKDNKKLTIKVKINKNLKNKTNNLVFIDVYDNYIIVQFLADDNGEKIYMEGNIDEN